MLRIAFWPSLTFQQTTTDVVTTIRQERTGSGNELQYRPLTTPRSNGSGEPGINIP